MIRNYTAYYCSELDSGDTLEYALGALSMSAATLAAAELKPDGYILLKLLFTPDWT